MDVRQGRVAYDVIGDIHGHAAKLERLLERLGYAPEGERGYRPPAGRRAAFVGDLIDRGPEQIRVYRIVRSMVEAGHAVCAMGNHEWNAIGWAEQSHKHAGQFLREHNEKNLKLHAAFLRQVGQGSPLHQEMVEWFRSLPPFLELDGLRVVHAWWHQPYVDAIRVAWPDGTRLSDEVLHAACDRGSPLWEAVEGVMKGLEVDLPPGCSYRDHAGIERSRSRTKWWVGQAPSIRDVLLLEDEDLAGVPDHPLPADYPGGGDARVPTIIGHYWMSGTPRLLAPNVACVDFSAAAHGPLVAYRWDGEKQLSASNFVLHDGAQVTEIARERVKA